MEHGPPRLLGRQFLVQPRPTTTGLPHTCRPFLLPSGGLVNIGGNSILTLTNEAIFQPPCPTIVPSQPVDPLDTSFDISILDKEKPFSESLDPQIYAISAVTIVSYMLVIILFITPRTFYVGGAGGGVSILGRRGTTGPLHGSNTVIGIGSRPWLQKLAALTLAASLTIVTADTFKWAEKQYHDGYRDAAELSEKVNRGLEIRIVRLISESFLWLAQAQTLIRLFQRHREKVVIKWTAFVLITLEIIFSILNHFVHEGNPHQPRAFASSIPALNYLFALSLNICYAAFVIIYALRKRRFAFFHPQMHSMPLTALLSLAAVLIPAIFFILDLSKPDVSGWGSYVRWVGDCAASVVVWEWVERIEALEREEKKDGILGREVFEGDEMLDNGPPKRTWPSTSSVDPKNQGQDRGLTSSIRTRLGSVMRVAHRLGRPRAPEPVPLKEISSDNSQSSAQALPVTNTDHVRATSRLVQPNPLPNTGSPVSRADTTSAASTEYMVRYHPVTQQTPPISENHQAENGNAAQSSPLRRDSEADRSESSVHARTLFPMIHIPRIPLPFKRQRQSPPAEISAALANQQLQPQITRAIQPPSILERLRFKKPQNSERIPANVIVVPAPRRKSSASGNHPYSDDEPASYDFDDDDDDDDDIEGEDDRPPAVVRNAIRRSNPASPVSENGMFSPSPNALAQGSGNPIQPILPTPRINDVHTERTDHDR